MKIGRLIAIPLFLLTLSCSAKDTTTVNVKTAKNIVTHYFATTAKVATTRQPAFITGDFNGDGIEDLAVLIKLDGTLSTSRQVQVSSPWEFPGSVQSNSYATSLVIINGSKDGWMSADTQVYVLLDKSGVLETPSFQLMQKNKSDPDYSQIQAMLPVKNAGDLIVLPTEAGIDTYIYWYKTSYRLFTPDEVP